MSRTLKKINKSAYISILEEIRMPLYNLREKMFTDKSMTPEIMKYFNEIEDFLQSLGDIDEFDITEDTDCWGDNIERVTVQTEEK
tara:strand:- start:1111 stop:1365 length:255 start_codon:yes stop_codon:yes gene_type:complete